MSILWILSCLAFGATGVLAGVAGARWQAHRRRQVAESEDTRDTQIRELLAALKLARSDVQRAREAGEAAAEAGAAANASSATLESELAETRAQLQNTQQLLQGEIDRRTSQQEELLRLSRTNENLKQRIQELELELHVSHSADMLDPELQVS